MACWMKTKQCTFLIQRPLGGYQESQEQFGSAPSDCPFQFPDENQTSNSNINTSVFVLKFVRIIDY